MEYWVTAWDFIKCTRLICFSLLILFFAGFILNWWQSISWCVSLHSQHVRPFFFSFCFSSSSEAFLLSFLSLLAFKKLEYIFILKFSFGGCWCFVLAFWMEIIPASKIEQIFNMSFQTVLESKKIDGIIYKIAISNSFEKLCSKIVWKICHQFRQIFIG